MAPKSFNNVFTLARQIFKWAQHPARAFLANDPLIGVKRLKLRPKEAVFLEDDEQVALLAAAADDPEANAIVHLAMFCGLRRSEVFGLQWADVEVNGGRIRVERSISYGQVTETKTLNSERVVDVPAAVLDALERHRRATPPMDDGWIFRSSSGRPLDPANWYKRRFVPLRQRAGLRDGVGLHALRHSFCSLLIRNNENPKYIARQMGHSSVAFTMDVYGHLFETTSTAAMSRLDETIRAAKRLRFEVVEGGRK